VPLLCSILLVHQLSYKCNEQRQRPGCATTHCGSLSPLKPHDGRGRGGMEKRKRVYERENGTRGAYRTLQHVYLSWVWVIVVKMMMWCCSVKWQRSWRSLWITWLDVDDHTESSYVHWTSRTWLTWRQHWPRPLSAVSVSLSVSVSICTSWWNSATWRCWQWTWWTLQLWCDAW